MLLKSRHPSNELQVFRKLSPRKILSEKEKQYFFYLEKGYEGEVQFDQLIEKLEVNWLILNDLLLEQGNSFFQIDSSMITHKKIYLFDVKNFEGEFIVKGDKWESITGKEIKNPLHQLSRAEALFNRYLQELGYQYTISAYLIFINPHFTLFQAPYTPNLILPTQLPAFLKRLGSIESNISEKHMVLAKKILSNLATGLPNPFIPTYSFEELGKGVVCGYCHSLIQERNNWLITCPTCGGKEYIESAILRNIEDYHFLFPEKKLTTMDVVNWCKVFDSRKAVHRVLTRNYKRVGHGKFSYYISE